MSQSLVALGCVVAMAALWRVITLIERTAIGPGGLLVGLWVFAAGVPLLVWTIGDGSDLIRSSAYLLVLGFAAAAAFPAALAARNLPAVLPERALDDRGSAILRRCVWITFAAGLFHPLYIGFSVAEHFGATDLTLVPALVAKARYEHTWDPPLFMSVVRIFPFVCAALCGFGYGDRRLRRSFRGLLFCWLVPALLSFVVEASRMAFIFQAVFAVASYCAGAAYFGSMRDVGMRTVVVRAMAVIALVVPLVHIGYSFRLGAANLETNLATVNRTLTTAFGYMPALGYWIDQGGMGRNEGERGLYSLSGITAVLGGPQRPQGLYEEAVQIETADLDATESNVYTGFRLLVDDFGLIGALIVIALAAFLAGVSWVSLARGKIAGYALTLAFGAFVLCSPATNIFVYNSAVGAVVVAAVVVYLVCRGGSVSEVVN